MTPKRVVSLAPSNTEIVFALGLDPILAGVTSFCDFPPAAGQKLSLSGWTNLSVDQILALKPDLALTSGVLQQDLAMRLRKAGLEVLHLDPRSLADVAASFVTIGACLGGDGRALAESFLSQLESIKKSRAGRPRPRVYVEEWDKPPMAAGNWVPELVQTAGGEPFNRVFGAPSAALTWEELMEFDPELVVYSVCGLSTRFDPAVFLRTEGWNSLAAATKRLVFSVDDSLFNRPGPRLVQGAALVAGLCDEALGSTPLPASLQLRRLP